MQPPSIITLQQRSRRLSADLETPISLFLSLTQNQTPGLLLESAEVLAVYFMKEMGEKRMFFYWRARRWMVDGAATASSPAIT